MSFGLEFVIVDERDGTQSRREFRSSTVRIGRNEMNDLFLEQPFVSQFHAVVEVVGEDVVLRDLGSTNGSIVQGQKISSDAASLGHLQGSFKILCLLFRVRALPVAALAASKSGKKAMNVTGYLSAPPPALLSALIAAQSEKPNPQEAAELHALYENYRLSWSAFHANVQKALSTRSESSGGVFLTQISSKYPAVMQEPDFHRLATAGGATALASHDSSKLERIALEGLKELATEYLPAQRPPETAAEVVQFLTNLRAVLDVWFKAFVPLRDGQRQLESELAIGRRQTLGHPLEVAGSSREVAHALLSGSDAGDAVRIVESTLADIMIHHVAMLNGLMRGVRTLLAEVSPETVKKAAEQMETRGVFSRGFGGGYKQLWQAFERCHADLVGEEKQLFGLLFGRQFTQAYNQSVSDS